MITVEGKDYDEVAERERTSCAGCAFQEDARLCNKVDECFGVIFVPTVREVKYPMGALPEADPLDDWLADVPPYCGTDPECEACQ